MDSPQQRNQHRHRTRTRRAVTLGRSPRPRTPSPPAIANTALLARDDATTTACSLCATITPCINCGKGQVCQQIFRPQGDCQTCPSNVCVSDGSSSSSGSHKAAAIAGPLGGVFGTLTLALVLVYFWWKRRKTNLAHRATARAEAKMRDAKTKGFLLNRSGDGPNRRGAGANDNGDGGDDDDDDDDDHRAADTEWTELRPDGLTTFQNSSGAVGVEQGRLRLDVGQPLGTDFLGTSFDSQRRHSSSAATHLSRITEGHEEDDEDGGGGGGGHIRRSQRFKDHNKSAPDNLGVLDNIEIISSADATVRGFNGLPRSMTADSRTDSRSDSRTSSISSGRGGSASDQHARSRSRRSLRNPFEPQDELAAPDVPSAPTLAEASTTSSTPIPGGRSSLGSTLSAFPVRNNGDANVPPMPMEPLPAHRPTGAPLIGLDMAAGSGKRQVGAGPARPIRDAELNLRLADGCEPGKVGADLKRNQTNCSAGTWRSSVGGVHAYSPAAPSTAHSRQFNLLDEPLPPHPSIPSQYSEPSSASATATATPTLSPGARSPGDTDSSPGHGEFLQVSGDWEERQRHNRKRLSARSTATTGTTGTTASDYVMAAPQIVMARSPDDAPRAVQVKRGAAQLVRNLSDLRRKGSLKKRGEGGTGAGVGAGTGTGTGAVNTPVTSPQNEVRDPFSDENSVAHHEVTAPVASRADEDRGHDWESNAHDGSSNAHESRGHSSRGHDVDSSAHDTESIDDGESEISPTMADATSPAASDGTFGPRTASAPEAAQRDSRLEARSPRSPMTATTMTTTTVISPTSTVTPGFTPAGEEIAFGSEAGRSAVGLGAPPHSRSTLGTSPGWPPSSAAASSDASPGGSSNATPSASAHTHVGANDNDRSRTDSMSTYSSFGIPIMDLTSKGTGGATHPAQRGTSATAAAAPPAAPLDRSSGASWTLPYLAESGGDGAAGAENDTTAASAPAPASSARVSTPTPQQEQEHDPHPDPDRARTLSSASRSSGASIGGLSVLDGFAWSVRTGDDETDDGGLSSPGASSAGRASTLTAGTVTPTQAQAPVAHS